MRLAPAVAIALISGFGGLRGGAFFLYGFAASVVSARSFQVLAALSPR